MEFQEVWSFYFLPKKMQKKTFKFIKIFRPYKPMSGKFVIFILFKVSFQIRGNFSIIYEPVSIDITLVNMDIMNSKKFEHSGKHKSLLIHKHSLSLSVFQETSSKN